MLATEVSRKEEPVRPAAMRWNPALQPDSERKTSNCDPGAEPDQLTWTWWLPAARARVGVAGGVQPEKQTFAPASPAQARPWRFRAAKIRQECGVPLARLPEASALREMRPQMSLMSTYRPESVEVAVPPGKSPDEVEKAPLERSTNGMGRTVSSLKM
ncbi:MAG: hypothetical protein ABUT39_20615 [Acidobacteriota bacterium]